MKSSYLKVVLLILAIAVFFVWSKVLREPSPGKEQPAVTKSSAPAAKPARKLTPGKPKITFVIDDIGHHIQNRQRFIALGSDVTYAILPHLKYSKYYGDLSRQTGAEVILHQPMQTVNNTIPGPGLILSNMDNSQVLDVLRSNLKSIPNHVGANNHMGSYGTTDPKLMEIILKEFKRRGLFFLDSMTTSNSQAKWIGARMGVPVLKRDVFLDNVESQPAIRRQVRQLAEVARIKGYAVGIGHDKENTLIVLSQEIPRLKEQGYEIISLSDWVRNSN